MRLHPLEGHEEARRALARSFRSGRLPPVLLLHGPLGVGKQRFALWLGQMVLCEAPTDDGPCGTCRPCDLALRLEHPELHWYFPVPRPPARGSAEREQEALEEARMERLASYRETPLRPSSPPEEVEGIHLGTIRNLRKEASRTPSMGSRRIFVIAEAEELVAQESATEAANALLKILEEPPENTWIVLTASEPGRLLPTIRSRVTAMYVPPLSPARVLEFLRRVEAGEPEAGDGEKGVVTRERAAELSGGAIGRALGFLRVPDEKKKGALKDGPLDEVRKRAYDLLVAALAPGSGRRAAQALGFQPWGARGLHELLTSLEGWLRDLAAVASGSEAPLLNGRRDPLAKTVAERGIGALEIARAVSLVEEARTRAAGNVNPQLLVSGLLSDIHRTVLPARAPVPRTRASRG